jgi:hypothetical protein
MSLLFYDHLVKFEKVAEKVNVLVSPVEKEELWALVDSLVHHRVMDIVLGKLSQNHHEEFLAKFTCEPHNCALLEYLDEQIGAGFSEIITNDLLAFEEEILTLFEMV